MEVPCFRKSFLCLFHFLSPIFFFFAHFSFLITVSYLMSFVIPYNVLCLYKWKVRRRRRRRRCPMWNDIQTHTWIADKWDCYYNEVISFLDIFLSIWQRDINQYIRYHLHFLHPASTRHLNRQTNNVQYVCVGEWKWWRKRKIKQERGHLLMHKYYTFLHQFRCRLLLWVFCMMLSL